jgi:hypothetical protein
VVDVGQDVDIAQIRVDRDLIWAAAVAAYDEGIEWWLPKELELYHHHINEQYQQNDMWDSLIKDRLSLVTSFKGSIEYTFIPLVADKILTIPTDKQDGRISRRIASILRVMGFDLDTIRLDGKPTKAWTRSNDGVTKVFDKTDLSNLGNALKPLPSLTVTKVTQDTQLFNKEGEKLISSNEDSEIINNYSLPIGTNEVTGNLSIENNETKANSEVHPVTHTPIKIGDRVKNTPLNKSGVVERIDRHPKHPKISGMWARVIQDDRSEWWAEYDYLEKIE